MDTNVKALSCLRRQLRQSSEVGDLIRCLRNGRDRGGGGASGSDDDDHGDWRPGSAVADLVERIHRSEQGEDGDCDIMAATALMEIAHEKLYTGKWNAVPQMWRDGKEEEEVDVVRVRVKWWGKSRAKESIVCSCQSHSKKIWAEVAPGL